MKTENKIECCWTCKYLNRTDKTPNGKYRCSAEFGYTIPESNVKTEKCHIKMYKFILDE